MDNKVTDPVCGMRLEPSQAAAQSTYRGQTYYFCSPEDKRKFDEAPQKYSRQAPQTEHHS